MQCAGERHECQSGALQAYLVDDGFDRLLRSLHRLLDSLDGPTDLNQLPPQLGQALPDGAREDLRPGGGSLRRAIVVEGVPKGGHRGRGRLVGEVRLAEAGGCAAVQLAVGGGLSDP